MRFIIQGLLLPALMLCLVSVSAVDAAIPQLINYQGRITDASGDPVADGNYLVNFTIYDAETAGTDLWTSGFQNVATVGGLYSYLLGSNVSLPISLFNNHADLWLGITVGADPELMPRQRISASAFSFKAARADLAENVLPASIGTAQIKPTEVQRRVSTIAPEGEYIRGIGQDGSILTGVDQAGGTGDITGVLGQNGLTGGGESGDVILEIDSAGVTSYHIANETIENEDVKDFGITKEKIYGTAATTQLPSTFGANQTFNGNIFVNDSTMTANGDGIIIGTDDLPSENYLVRIDRHYDEDSPSNRRGIELEITNESDGTMYGIEATAENTTAGLGGTAAGVRGFGKSDGIAYGYYGEGSQQNINATTGSSYGAWAKGRYGFTAYGVRGEANSAVIGYGIYGSASGNSTDWAGYFNGDVNVVGTLSKGGGSFRIDHPLDPENKFLQHSFVESPDMKNIYDGVITLDRNGAATVTMPEWFEALNRDFRYQLTPIGTAMPGLHISAEIDGREFSIAGGEPGMKVSWMVTGIRHDPWANQNRIEVEVQKKPHEAGRYAHPEAHGQPRERGIDWHDTQSDLPDVRD